MNGVADQENRTMTQEHRPFSNFRNGGFVLKSLQLLFDSRVPASLKLLLPVAAGLYWLSPLDLMPMLPFDDLVVLFGALALFVKLASDQIERQQGQPQQEESVVDTTWRVVE
jgi:uncharacterized membrane protein YkvA (DUF1232 family)